MNYSKILINLILSIEEYHNIDFLQDIVKCIYKDERVCFTSQEKKIKRFFNSSNYIFNNINQSFTENLIIQAHFLLTNKLLDKEITAKIIELYYKNIDVAPHSLAALLHLYIINNTEENNIEFAFLISNYVMLKRNRYFLMPYEYCHSDYREAIEDNDISNLIRIFYDIELVKKEKKACQLSKDEVIQKIKTIKEELVSIYCVDKLYLFGSFAKGNNTEKSDLDFVAIFNELLINIEKKEMIIKVKTYLIDIFNCDVDLLDFSYALDSFDKSQMEYLITLI